MLLLCGDTAHIPEKKVFHNKGTKTTADQMDVAEQKQISFPRTLLPRFKAASLFGIALKCMLVLEYTLSPAEVSGR